MSDSRTYEDWISVFETGTDYEADIVRDRLDDAGMTAVVLTQRDHAFNLNVGDLAAVHVMVPPDTVEEARELLESEPFTDEELDEAAMNADPDAEPAHSDREEAMLDSSPNLAGDDGDTIEAPGVHEEEDEGDGSGEADARAKRRHRDERRARHQQENRPAGEDAGSVAREGDALRDEEEEDRDEDSREDDSDDRS